MARDSDVIVLYFFFSDIWFILMILDLFFSLYFFCMGHGATVQWGALDVIFEIISFLHNIHEVGGMCDGNLVSGSFW